MRITKCDKSVSKSIIFLKRPKINFSNPNATFNGTTVMGRSKAAKTIEPPSSKVNIELATAICLQKQL